MKNWEKSLEKFVEPWKTEKGVEGIFVVGSHSMGLNRDNSDIDVQIVLSNSTPWKERGSLIVDGFIIDYSATPYGLLQHFMEQTRGNVKITSRKLATGKIIFDKKGLAKKLQGEAKKKLKEKFKKPGKGWVETQRYLLWFGLQDLTGLYTQKSPGFYYEYRLYIKELIEAYSIFKQADVIQSSKTYHYLTDKAYAKKYKTHAFPDAAFNALLLSCLRAPDDNQKMARINELANYTINKMGGFEVDGWKLRTSLK